MLRDVAHVLEREIKTAQVATKKVGGIKAIAEMLNNMDRQKSSELIARIEENDPEMAEEIRQNMFIFEDLIKIDDRGVQEIMKERFLFPEEERRMNTSKLFIFFLLLFYPGFSHRSLQSFLSAVPG